MTDIEIARSINPKKIGNVAKKINLSNKDLIFYGDYKAKIKYYETIIKANKFGKLVLVTAINPTSSGNGKTTVSIGLADAFSLLKQKVCLALREPSLGPVFGIKGGATGGGYSQVLPMEDINLHFNGDFHAITSANNLLCSLIDNHIFQGNELKINPNKVFFKRCIDLNDRALRQITVAQSKDSMGRGESFTITAASEVMAIMCLANNLEDLKVRLSNIMVALNENDEPVYAKDLKAENAMAILLKDALKPNLVQTLKGTPAIIHCGPFANIAHGCNSIIATKTAMALSDYCITEAGFGADLGAEKFLDLKCRLNNIKPDCVVLVATIKALKLHGEKNKDNLTDEDIKALKKGMSNLVAHINVIKNVFHLPLVVTLNKFLTDTKKEIETVKNEVEKLNVEFAINDSWGKGGKGTLLLAEKVIKLCDAENKFSFAYNLDDSVEKKMNDIVQKIYGANKVVLSEKAKEKIATINKLKLNNLPVIMAKTQYSLSDDAKKMGAPKNYDINVRDIEIRTGAGFLVAVLGNMLLMPALSKTPAAVNMTITNNEIINGLF